MPDFTTPVGRLVQGSAHEATTTDQQGRPLLVKSGPNVGKPMQKWFFALAIPKSDASFQALHQMMQASARTGFPTLFNPQGQCIRPDFAWKLVDGDSQTPNQNNKRPCDQEGFAGCWVLKFSTSLKAPRCYDSSNNPIEGNTIKPGYWIRVSGSVEANGDMGKPGLYLNPNLIQLCGYGPEISYGISAAEAFAQPVALPPGASAAPVAPAAGIPGATPAQVAPAYDYVAPAIPPTPAAPPQYAAPPPPVAAPAPAPAQYLVQGVAYSEAALRGAGYTDAQLASLPRA